MIEMACFKGESEGIITNIHENINIFRLFRKI